MSPCKDFIRHIGPCVPARVILAVLALVVLASCDKDDGGTNEPPSGRTVIVYMVAENSLASYAYADVNEMLSAAAQMGDDDRLVIYLDNTLLPRVYIVTNKTKATTLSDLTPVKSYDADWNSASAEVLQEVVAFAEDKCPNADYGLVLWSHASGWIPSTYSADSTSSAAPLRRSAGKGTPRKSFGIDNGLNTQSDVGWQMNVDDMARCLSQFPKFQFMLFDACFMQCAEVAYELRDCTAWLLGAPAEIPGDGAPYQNVLPLLFARTFSPSAVTDSYVNFYRNDMGALFSAVDCSQMDDFAAATRILVQAYRQMLLEADYDSVQNYFNYDRYRSLAALPDYFDMQGIMRNVLPQAEYTAWKSRLDALAVRDGTPMWYSMYANRLEGNGFLSLDQSQYGGISMFVPLEKYENRHEAFYDAFAQTSWAQAVWY